MIDYYSNVYTSMSTNCKWLGTLYLEMRAEWCWIKRYHGLNSIPRSRNLWIWIHELTPLCNAMPFGWNFHISGIYGFHTYHLHVTVTKILITDWSISLSWTCKSNLNSISQVNISRIAPKSIVSGQQLPYMNHWL